MPFTPAHPAIILPLLRINPKYVSATGLIVGSVTPDFEYFFKMSVDGQYGHTIAGLLYFDLPVAFMLSLVFHLVIKINFIDNLPTFFQKRLKPLRDFDFLTFIRKNYGVFALSALVGSASHIFWDSFTHVHGFFVKTLPFYEGKFIPYDGVKYPLWYSLQHISTFVGLSIVAVYICLIKPVVGTTGKPSLLYWFFIFTLSAIIILIRFEFTPMNADIGNFVVSTISALCLAVLAAGFIPFRTSSYG